MGQEYCTLGNITVEKNALIAKLQSNMNKHKDMYEAALNDFKIVLKYNMDKLKLDFDNFNFDDETIVKEYRKLMSEIYGLQIPTNHIKEYTKAIAKLQYDIHDFVLLTNSEFDNFVLDNWDWNSSFYSICSGTQIYASEIKAGTITAKHIR